MFSFFAATITGNIPSTGKISPYSDKTPKTAAAPIIESLNSPASFMTPIAITKSKLGLFFFCLAGDKLMTTFLFETCQWFS